MAKWLHKTWNSGTRTRDAAFFAVYDGHGGSKIASHVSKHLHKTLVRRPEYKQGNYEEAFVKSFLECDEAMRKDETLF